MRGVSLPADEDILAYRRKWGYAVAEREIERGSHHHHRQHNYRGCWVRHKPLDAAGAGRYALDFHRAPSFA